MKFNLIFNELVPLWIGMGILMLRIEFIQCWKELKIVFSMFSRRISRKRTPTKSAVLVLNYITKYFTFIILTDDVLPTGSGAYRR